MSKEAVLAVLERAAGDIGRKLNEGMIMTKVLIPLLSREGW